MGRLQGQRALVARTVAQIDENENQLGGDIQQGGGQQGGDIQQGGGQQGGGQQGGDIQQGGVHQGGVQQAAGQQGGGQQAAGQQGGVQQAAGQQGLGLKMCAMNVGDQVTKAETICALKVVASNFSFKSTEDLLPILRAMDPSSSIFKKMSLSSDYVLYSVHCLVLWTGQER